MKQYLLLFALFFSLCACGEGSEEPGNHFIYEDPFANENEKSPNNDDDDNMPDPSDDYTIQRITRINYYMDQCYSDLSMQGSALYGNILFQFVNGNAEIYVYDLEKKMYLGTIKCKSYSRWHNNQATFSNIFYEEGDEFPLLYVSQIVYSEQTIQVWRVVRTKTLFDLQLVQEIQMPFDNDDNNLYHFNIVIDNSNKYFWLYSRNRSTSLGQISKWELPDAHTAKITLTEEDMLERFPIDVIMKDAQGGCMIGQRIYFVQGVPSRSELRFHIVNTNTQEVTTFNLRDFNFRVEAEGLSFCRGRFICTTYKHGIYEIYLNSY